MLKDITVLISASGSPTAPGLINCFKANGERNIRVVGIDMSDDPTAKYLVDCFYKVPAATSENYIDIVVDICKKEKVDIYFPNISAEVTQVTKRKDEFMAIGTIVSSSSQNSIEIANNKLRLYEYLESNGVAVPKFYGMHSIDEFESGCKYLGYPYKAICLKIVDGSGSRGVRIIDSNKDRYQIFINEKPNSFFVAYEDMLSILKQANEFHEMLLVNYLSGNEYTVDALADNGRIVYIAGRENTVSLMSIAQDSTVLEDKEAYSLCHEIVRLLNYSGNIGFDFMRDENGKAVLMDINPRITATVSVIAAAGLNLPYLRVKQLLEEQLPSIEIKYGTRMRRRYCELFTDFAGRQIQLGAEI